MTLNRPAPSLVQSLSLGSSISHPRTHLSGVAIFCALRQEASVEPAEKLCLLNLAMTEWRRS